jgi:HSP20 family protein
MAALRLRDPFHDFIDLRDSMDRMFDRFLTGPRLGWEPSWDLNLDVAENDNEFVVRASIPGINPDDLDITYTDRVLTVKGEVKGDKDLEKAKYHLRERWYGSFARSVQLPVPVKAEDIRASYEAGVLTLHLPKTEEVKPKRIAVHTESPRMIEGKIKNGKK